MLSTPPPPLLKNTGQYGFTMKYLSLNDKDDVTNSVDPDQTAQGVV